VTVKIDQAIDPEGFFTERGHISAAQHGRLADFTFVVKDNHEAA